MSILCRMGIHCHTEHLYAMSYCEETRKDEMLFFRVCACGQRKRHKTAMAEAVRFAAGVLVVAWLLTSLLTNAVGSIAVDQMAGGLRGHLLVTGTAPAVSSCGTTPSTVSGSDTAGRLTWGSGGTDATCTVTFAVGYATAPACVCVDETDAGTTGCSASASATVLTLTSSSAVTGASDVFTFICGWGLVTVVLSSLPSSPSS